MRRSSPIVLLLALAGTAAAKPLKYPDPSLNFVYPAGGRQGQTVVVELAGLNGLTGATGVVIDGAPGISVRDVKAVNPGLVRATFVIAPDAPVGRRLVRVVGGTCGLTNCRPFFVGRLPEVLEKEPNQTPEAAQEVTIPAVINGRIDPALDVDCYAFRARAGQHIVAAVLAHGMDTLLRGKAQVGFLDTSLELLDVKGRVLASAEDTLGLDPLLDYTIKTDGRYVVRVQSTFFKGAPSAVYRLTLGEVPYPTHITPPGGRRGEKVEVEFSGPNVKPRTRRTITVPAAPPPWQYVAFDDPLADGRELPFVCGEFPERAEVEPNDDRKQAMPLTLPVTVNGRFDRPGDEDWYRKTLKKGQGVLLDVAAQRHLRSPVDTLLQVYSASGQKLAENDDGALFAHPNHCGHDFASADSWLPFKAPTDGDYFIRLSKQSGAGGPLALYRLSVSALEPDFLLYQWPDAVPIWGPGTTAAFIVHMQQWGGLRTDVRVRVEGLPPGWTGSASILPVTAYGIFSPPYGMNALLTISAPADAAPGTTASFRVVGRVEQGGRVLERVAQPMTLYGSSHNDRLHLRFSSGARAVVTPPLDCRLEAPVKELTVRWGEPIEVPVKVHRRPGVKSDLAVSVDGPTIGGAAGCGWAVPLALKPNQDEAKVRLTVAGKRKPGTYGIVVSRAWAADLRAGRPGPCTPIILLHVLPPKGFVKGP